MVVRDSEAITLLTSMQWHEHSPVAAFDAVSKNARATEIYFTLGRVSEGLEGADALFDDELVDGDVHGSA